MLSRVRQSPFWALLENSPDSRVWLQEFSINLLHLPLQQPGFPMPLSAPQAGRCSPCEFAIFLAFKIPSQLTLPLGSSSALTHSWRGKKAREGKGDKAELCIVWSLGVLGPFASAVLLVSLCWKTLWAGTQSPSQQAGSQWQESKF